MLAKTRAVSPSYFNWASRSLRRSLMCPRFSSYFSYTIRGFRFRSAGSNFNLRFSLLGVFAMAKTRAVSSRYYNLASRSLRRSLISQRFSSYFSYPIRGFRFRSAGSNFNLRFLSSGFSRWAKTRVVSGRQATKRPSDSGALSDSRGGALVIRESLRCAVSECRARLERIKALAGKR